MCAFDVVVNQLFCEEKQAGSQDYRCWVCAYTMLCTCSFTHMYASTHIHNSARFLIVNVKPVGVGAVFPALGFLGLYFSLSFLLKTGCIDAGIVPRALPDEVAYMQSLGDEGMCTCMYPHIDTVCIIQ